jgi:hypothetical protein
VFAKGQGTHESYLENIAAVRILQDTQEVADEPQLRCCLIVATGMDAVEDNAQEEWLTHL